MDLDNFCRLLVDQCPPLARIDALERQVTEDQGLDSSDFRIVSSDPTAVKTGVVADAATCAACAAEIRDPFNRRYRYPFTNCTHCGPRLSIVRGIPYDRANTSMAVFGMCGDCRREYEDPADRRFHAQPNACPVCGPTTWMEDAQGKRLNPDTLGAPDAVDAASRLLAQGKILAIKGVGGFHLACDACNPQAVSELRRRKRRYRKPFALMARGPDVVRRYCTLTQPEEDLLRSQSAPVALLSAGGPERVADGVAPGQVTLGFMLPYSPLHILLLGDWDRPLVMTSGNRSEEPQCIEDSDAKQRLSGLADFFLLHNREIVNRVDDSVVRVMDGAPRSLRRARGYAPAPISLPPGFEETPPILAFGGELKNTICLLEDRQAILSQHLGDLEEANTAAEYERTIDLYRRLFQHAPQRISVDLHPDYRSSRLGRDLARLQELELVEVQHHHAHIASVMADNGRSREAGKVLGIALDGLGYGSDGTIWGAELLVADYRGFERVGHLDPVSMPGGIKAILEPWRNTYAQIMAHIGWQTYAARWPNLELTRFLGKKPLGVMEAMVGNGLNSPMSSSAGRLFDAVAAALGICRGALSYEGQAAIELEAAAVRAGSDVGDAYPFAVQEREGLLVLNSAPMWAVLFDDLAHGESVGSISARFHRGFTLAVSGLAARLAEKNALDTVALSGGVFQNKTLLEGVSEHLRNRDICVLTHRQVPANDGGLALGQAVVAAARV
jgi:hydrogenase maturation protein HypF